LVFMWLTFELTFRLGGVFAAWLEAGFAWLGGAVSAALAEGPLRSLLVEGIINGVGSVIVFLPNILVMFFMISLLEDSGYMARAAFIMDRPMHRVGLHGKSFMPMLLGFGCNVPAIMGTRILESDKDRLITILISPLMSCSARLPVYVLLASALFRGREAPVVFSLYALGVLLAVMMAWLFRRFLFRGPDTPFVMELPPYRLPTLKGTAIHMWERGKLFLQKAGTVIFAASVIVWFLGALPWGVPHASETSYAGRMGQLVRPLLAPLGFDWKMTVALMFGFFAKEIVAGTLGVLYGVAGPEGHEAAGLRAALQAAFSPLTAYAFMTFTLIYTPCLATVAVIRRETGSWKWTAFSVVYQLALAWLVAFVVYQVGRLLGFG
jgi:ferrous iron transport protein B